MQTKETNQPYRQCRGPCIGDGHGANATLRAAPVRSMKARILSVCAVPLFSMCVCLAQPYFVSPSGDDANPGTLESIVCQIP